jgi:hypothetical protein
MFSKLVMLIVLVLTCYQGLAQATSLDVEVFRAVVAGRNNGPKLMYVQNVKMLHKVEKRDGLYKKIMSGVFLKIDERYDKDKEEYRSDTTDKLVLTKREKRKILARIKDSIFWPTDIAENSIALQDTALLLHKLFTSDTNFCAKYNRQLIQWVQKPVFFRSNTFCIISQRSLYGFSSGHIYDSVYQKLDDKWVLFCHIAIGVICQG